MPTTADLLGKTCVPCEGGIPRLTADEVAALLPTVPGWTVAEDGGRILRKWKTKGFDAAIAACTDVAAIANRENHHPDLHVEGYRHLRIEIRTHAIDGLSENDFILAAKINALPWAR